MKMETDRPKIAPRPAGAGRIAWVDYAKSAAIFLVVLLHTHCNPTLAKSINAFIMPLFFVISGYLFSYTRNPSFGRFAAKRFRQLVVPYLWINLVAWVAWVAVLRHYGDDAATEIEWHTPLRAIFVGIPPLLLHDIPLWSLLSFFVVEMIFYPLGRVVTVWVVALIFIVLPWGMELLIGDGMRFLPLTLGPSVAGVGFYALGHMAATSAPWGHAFRRLTGNAAWMLLPAAILAAAVLFNGEVMFFICRYGGFYPLYLLGSVAGALVVIALARMAAHWWGDCRPVVFLSDSTLTVCGFHLLMFAAIKGVALFGFGVAPPQLTDGIVRGVAFALVALLLCLPVAWLTGRRRAKIK